MKTMTGVILAGAALAAWGQDDEGRRQAVRKLDSVRISVDLRESPLAPAIDYFREATGLNIVLTPAAAEKDADAKVTLRVRDVSARAALRLLLRPRDLAVVWRDGALQVVPRGEAEAAVVLRMYDVRAHLVKVQDFSGPRMELVSPDSPNPMGIKVDFDPEPRDPPVGEDLLVELVKGNTGRRSWEENPAASITLANGVLVVSQTPAVHREIQALLSGLLQYR